MKKKNKKIKKSKLLSVIIIAKNEELKIRECLESVYKYADEIVLIDSGSIDKTIQIAKEYKAVVVPYDGGSYSDWRNAGLNESSGKWILYLDADERATAGLKEEINSRISSSSIGLATAYAIPRKNYIFGKIMHYGGQWPDYQKRFFLKSSLLEYKNDLHEEAVHKGDVGYFVNPIIHIKHDNLSDMVVKTNKWSALEATMLYKSGHPKMVWWRFIRIMLTEFSYRMISQRSYKDGAEGIIYAIYQVWSKFITYAKLWELQILNSKKI